MKYKKGDVLESRKMGNTSNRYKVYYKILNVFNGHYAVLVADMTTAPKYISHYTDEQFYEFGIRKTSKCHLFK